MIVQRLIILSGPNGAGKTSFANEYLAADNDGVFFINADEIAHELAVPAGPRLDFRAGRVMLGQMRELTEARLSFMFETTLSTRTFAKQIPVWRGLGYTVVLIYLRLARVEDAIDRVRRRARAGGHDIPEPVVRRRFARSLKNLEQIYKPLVDEWYVWQSLEGSFALMESWDQ